MNERLRIAMVSYYRPHLGGSGVMTGILARELARKGHEVHIVSYPGTYLSDEEKDLGITLHSLKNVDYPCFKAEPYSETLASLLADIDKNYGSLDIIHVNYVITHGLAGILAKRIIKRQRGDSTSPKIIVTSHGSDIHINGSHKLLSPIIQQILYEADGITYVSKSLQEQAMELFQDVKVKGTVVYNFVETKKFRPIKRFRSVMREALSIPQEAVVVYHASNFRPVKNTKLIVEAANVLINQQGRKNLYFLLLGEGPEKDELKQLVDSLNLAKYFRFVGKKENVIPYINTANIGILTSIRESFGLALLEAMSCGLAVIGSSAGGIPEVITHGKNGFVFKSEDCGSLVNVFEDLLDNKAIIYDMGKQSRQKVLKFFSSKRIISQYLAVYEDALLRDEFKEIEEKVVRGCNHESHGICSTSR